MARYNVDFALKPVLMGLAAIIFLWGATVVWFAARLANQEFLRWIPSNTRVDAIEMFGRPVTLFEAMIAQTAIGILICGVATGMFTIAAEPDRDEKPKRMPARRSRKRGH